jgi:hypothetical protein
MTDVDLVLRELGRHREELTRQQMLSLRGIALGGDPAGAMRGLESILRRVQAKRERALGARPGHKTGGA